MTDFQKVINNLNQIKKGLEDMATSLEVLTQRVADALTNLEDVKTGVLAMSEQNITQEEVNQNFDQIDAKINEIKQVINPQ